MSINKSLTIRGQFISEARGAIGSIRAIVVDAGIGGFGYGPAAAARRVAADFAADWGDPEGLEAAVHRIGMRSGDRAIGI